MLPNYTADGQGVDDSRDSGAGCSTARNRQAEVQPTIPAGRIDVTDPKPTHP